MGFTRVTQIPLAMVSLEIYNLYNPITVKFVSNPRKQNLSVTSRLKTLITFLFFFIFVQLTVFSNKVFAQCENRVPNPIDPNCQGSPTLFGSIANFIPLWPLFMFFVALYGYIRAIIKFAEADSAEQAKEGWGTIIRTTEAVILGFAIWIIMYFLEQILGVNLIIF